MKRKRRWSSDGNQDKNDFDGSIPTSEKPKKSFSCGLDKINHRKRAVVYFYFGAQNRARDSNASEWTALYSNCPGDTRAVLIPLRHSSFTRTNPLRWALSGARIFPRARAVGEVGVGQRQSRRNGLRFIQTARGNTRAVFIPLRHSSFAWTNPLRWALSGARIFPRARAAGEVGAGQRKSHQGGLRTLPKRMRLFYIASCFVGGSGHFENFCGRKICGCP